MYITENSFEKYSTKYKEVASFYLLKGYAHDVFEQLLGDNRVTLQMGTNKYSFKYDNKRHDPIYIRALYYHDNSRLIHLLVSNDARRRISNLYKTRKRECEFEKKFMSKLSTKFSFFGWHNCYGEFQKLLLENPSDYFISGSFPLQVYLDEDWPESDLDIFMPRSSNNKIKAFLEKTCPKKDLVPLNLQNNKNYNYKWDTSMSVCEYTLPTGFRIQVIEMLNYSMDSILRSFDFDFCKIAFYYYQDLPHLNIHNLTSILTRTCTYPLDRKIDSKYDERLAKYEKRGFKITNAKEMSLLASKKLK